MSLSCTFVPAPILGVEPNSTRTSPLTGNGGTEKNYLPADRVIDGVSMVPVFTQNKVIPVSYTHLRV